MPQDSRDRLQMRNIPWALWATCGLFIVIGLLPAILDGQWAWLILACAGLLLIVLFTNVTSLTAERGRGVVTLTSRTLLHGTQRREIPLRDITQVAIERSAGSEGPTFRVALVLASGERVPLADYYSGRRGDKEAAAQRLSDFLAQDRGSQVPVVDGATARHEETGRTAGSDWRLETMAGADGSPMMRWSTAGGANRDGLLIMSEIDPGMGRLHWDAGPLAGVSKWAYKSLLLEYQFKPADVEAVDKARPVQDLDPRLHVCYVAFATDADAARRWLSPARVETLSAWAAAHPTPHVQSGDGVMLGAVLLLAGPSGLWLVLRGSTQDPACIAEIGELGAALAAPAVTG